MKRYFLHAYEPRHAEQAVALLAQARRERRVRCPGLPAGLEEASSAARILERSGEGTVALGEDGALAGFMFAEYQEDATWGPGVVVEPNRWALAPGAGVGVLARLYAAEFEAKGRGVADHYVHCAAFDASMLQAWFQLGFGQEQAYAVARLEDMEVEEHEAEGLAIRRARSGDEDTLASLSPLIATLQAGAPVWAGAPASYLESLREGFRGLATDPEAIVLLAFRGERAVGHQAWFPVPEHPLDGASEGAIELAVGATVPDERGSGVGRALTARGVAEARRAGFTTCFTDWRTTNPLSSAFWPARGFRPFQYRLARRISPLAL